MKVTVLVAFVLFSTAVLGQSLRGSKFFQAGFGFRDIGPNISAYSGIAFSQTMKLQFGGGAGLASVADINYKYVFVDVMASMNMKEISRVVAINGLGGLSINGDFKNNFESSTYNKSFAFNYGIVGGMEGDFKATRSMSIVIHGLGMYYFKEDFGNLRGQVAVSLRFIL